MPRILNADRECNIVIAHMPSHVGLVMVLVNVSRLQRSFWQPYWICKHFMQLVQSLYIPCVTGNSIGHKKECP